MVDAGYLAQLYPVLEQTCEEFGLKDVNFFRISLLEAARGFYKQIVRNTYHTKSTVVAS